RSHRDLNEPRIGDLAGQREDFGSFALLGTDARETIGSFPDDRANVGEGFNIVDESGAIIQAALRRKWRPWSWGATLAFHPGHQGGLFATNKCPGANPQIDVETER